MFLSFYSHIGRRKKDDKNISISPQASKNSSYKTLPGWVRNHIYLNVLKHI